MAKGLVVFVFISGILFCSSGCSTSQSADIAPIPLPRPDSSAERRIYDGACAANSTYVLCHRSKIKISYSECLKLLPFDRKKGNSMLELKAALISLGFNVEAQRLAADEFSNIQVPAIFLVSVPPRRGSITTTPIPFAAA